MRDGGPARRARGSGFTTASEHSEWIAPEELCAEFEDFFGAP